jgi:hypothetical protein
MRSTKGVKGKHAARYAEGTNVVVLESDVAREFRTKAGRARSVRSVDASCKGP